MRLIFFIFLLYVYNSDQEHCTSHLCEWEVWKSWESCSRACGDGRQERWREICCRTDLNVDECLKHCGKSNSGFHETKTCGDFCCHGGTQNEQSCKCSPQYYGDRCEHDCLDLCEWEAWESWGSCSRSCGGGTQKRWRHIGCRHNTAECLGVCAKFHPSLYETRSCSEFCYNSGTLQGQMCKCSSQYDGHCCEYEKACLSLPCKHGGICTNIGNDFLCACKPGYETKDCNLDCYPGPTDVIFLLDTSQSETSYFNISLQYMKHFTERVPVSHHDFQFSVITYSTDTSVEFDFGEHVEKSNLVLAYFSIAASAGATHTAKALEKVFQVLSKPSYGVRVTGSPKYVIVLTDGLSTDRMDIEAVKIKLSAFNIRIMAVGIGSQVDHKELLQIATSPAFVFSPESNDAFHKVMIESIGEQCDVCSETSVSDIFFLLETSLYRTQEQLNQVLDAMEILITMLDIEKTEIKVGMAVFDENVHSLFHFSENVTTIKLQSKLQSTRRSSSRSGDVIRGIKYVRQTSFVESNGGRQKARKVIIIVSSGYWYNAHEIKEEITLCKKENITVLLVGPGQDVSLETMYDVASTPHNIIYLNSLKDKDNLKCITAYVTYPTCKEDLFS